MASRILSDLVGTLKTSFRIATVLWKDSATVIMARNKADSANVPVSLSRLDLRGASNANRVSITVAANPAADLTFNFPTADGSSQQAIVTDGAGNLSFATVGTGSNQVKEDEQVVAFNSAASLIMVTPPAFGRIIRVRVEIETAFDGVGAQLSVGVAGTPARYMAATDNELSNVANYEVASLYEEDGTPEQIIITFAAGTGATVGSARVTVTYANPSDA